MKLEPINLKQSHLNEAWVQREIAADPTILGLGDLILRDKERRQPGAGRLDLLLQDPETLKRYEVEVQLGATDESHIIRTIEYWDIERKRYPQYEHAAVIVAEDITSRFLNVIQLFNGAIPLIALKMTAYKIGDEYALTFVKVLDELVYGLVDEDEETTEAATRKDWEDYSKQSLSLTDNLFEIVKAVKPEAVMNYTEHYIGIAINGAACNFVIFSPMKHHVIVSPKLDQSDEIDEKLDEAGLDRLSYNRHFNRYRIKVDSPPNDTQRNVLREVIEKAKDRYGV